MKTKTLIIAGLLSFGGTLIATLPASFVIEPLNKPPNIHLSGVKGSLWSGSIAQATINNISWGEVRWKLRPLSLLTGKLGVKLDTKHPEAEIQGLANIHFSKELTLQEVLFSLNSSRINQLQPYAKFDGTAKGRIDTLYLKDFELSQAPLIDGILNLEEASMSSPVNIQQGNYKLSIENNGEENLGKISTHQAPVQISGNVTLNKDWNYKTDLAIKTTPTGKNLDVFLNMAGKKTPDGKLLIKLQGDLKPLLNR
ncbi:MAG: Unknown protein [uncultured Thiotrichaceae bacterium]|uniref:Type II secretion system protein N n=1 Tax=uncultured Thiotrichaceae bacterium TaxID=298394 RepID=A0A6S6SUC4_9GAMM|nr:MAG: Unknown protein [uncultured Thiotrichaceae bacterium]